MELIGGRIIYNNHRGVLRYVGLVDGTIGRWLGVEWDDPTRGKHDGSKDNKRYFTCGSSNAGSFIRPAHVRFGTSFLKALVSKYIEDLHGPGSQEKVLLGSSQGTIEVEAVGLDRVRANLANLENLREVSLDGTDVAFGNTAGEIHRSCPNVRGLDLSLTLISSWETVSQITSELPFLERLALNRNRFLLVQSNLFSSLQTAFVKLNELQLNGAMTSWQEIENVIRFMPSLRILEVGYNDLISLTNNGPNAPSASHRALESINLDGNGLDSWVHLYMSLMGFSRLAKVILMSNKIASIPFPVSGQWTEIQNVALSHNGLKNWSDVEALSCWCPSLETLTLTGNPLLTDNITARPFIIARLPALKTLDGTPVSEKERRDSELFYLSDIARRGLIPNAIGDAIPFRWAKLCDKHGTPDTLHGTQRKDEKLSSQLITLEVRQGTGGPSIGTMASVVKRKEISVLPTMSLRQLKAKLKQGMKTRSLKVNCWLKMQDNTWAELDSSQDSQTLDWIGLETGSQLYTTYD